MCSQTFLRIVQTILVIGCLCAALAIFFISGFSITVVLVVCTSVIFLLVLFSDLILRCRSCFIGEHVWGYFACGAFLEFITCAFLAFASLNLSEVYVEENKDHSDKDDKDNNHHNHFKEFGVALCLGIFCLATATCFFYDIFALLLKMWVVCRYRVDCLCDNSSRGTYNVGSPGVCSNRSVDRISPQPPPPKPCPPPQLCTAFEPKNRKQLSIQTMCSRPESSKTKVLLSKSPSNLVLECECEDVNEPSGSNMRPIDNQVQYQPQKRVH
ncbi:uncharacterized protein LOC126266345 [Aethina tumida]|uniref:uncharacterized protein LOC126266345 n=1 Tax=Aethina tumida TaxID=116153 RepID=UPI0021477EB0|nr:uncharacterized protein LOC126266345 [Aethina tumida]